MGRAVFPTDRRCVLMGLLHRLMLFKEGAAFGCQVPPPGSGGPCKDSFLCQKYCISPLVSVQQKPISATQSVEDKSKTHSNNGQVFCTTKFEGFFFGDLDTPYLHS